jgi:hypothetical protein
MIPKQEARIAIFKRQMGDATVQLQGELWNLEGEFRARGVLRTTIAFLEVQNSGQDNAISKLGGHVPEATATKKNAAAWQHEETEDVTLLCPRQSPPSGKKRTEFEVLDGTIAHLTMGCGGNVTTAAVIEVTLSAVSLRSTARNAVDLNLNSCFDGLSHGECSPHK